MTYQEFENLGHIDDASLARHLQEIAEYSSSSNRLGLPEVGFFGADFFISSPIDFCCSVRCCEPS